MPRSFAQARPWLLLGSRRRTSTARIRIWSKARQFIVNLTSFKSDVGDVLLPIAPFTETPGTFISTEGRVQGFHAAVRPLGDARPAWKVLRVLGTMLGLPGFEFETVEQVQGCLPGGQGCSRLAFQRD